ncbi:DMT family transporter [Actinosynnema sp. NPDC059335]|uniref:DMT family transporter n=1 Tax=Actinosynnema sp. NPDC059335 TaxID=3346804 RepID=UPI00366C0D2C
MTTEPSAQTPKWVPYFLACSLIWGSGFALIKIGVDAGIAPAWVAFWRCSFGAAVLWLLVLGRRLAVPRSAKVWGHALVVGTVLNALPFALFALGEQHISSLQAGVWNAMIPLLTLVWVLIMLPSEKPTPRRLAGLATGFTGALVVLGVWDGVEAPMLAGSVACLLAVASYGLGYTYTRKFLSDVDSPALTLTAIQIGLAALELAVVAPFSTGSPGLPTWPGWGPMAAMLVLGAVGTGIAYMWNLTVIRAVGSTVASTVAFLTPMWAALIGVLFLSEALHWNTVLGALLIISGVVLTRPPKPKPAAEAAAPAAVRAEAAE